MHVSLTRIEQFSVDMVMAVQNVFQPFDEFLSFVSAATNPSSVLHYLVPVSIKTWACALA